MTITQNIISVIKRILTLSDTIICVFKHVCLGVKGNNTLGRIQGAALTSPKKHLGERGEGVDRITAYFSY